VVCDLCRAGRPVLAAAVAGALRGLQAASWEARLAARVPSSVEQSAAAVLDEYVAVLVGAPLRAPRFLARTRPPGSE
jgi:hypothetical protein